MELKILKKSSRSAVIEIDDGGKYNTLKDYHLFVNGVDHMICDTVVTSVFGLRPGTEYRLSLCAGAEGCEEARCDAPLAELSFATDDEFVTIDVKALGAKGDGASDDTEFLQSAIMVCPEGGRILIPEGEYFTRPLFLKSNISIELSKGAEIIADTDRAHFPILPGLIQSYDERDEYNLGTWEGNPLSCFAGIITGLNVSNVHIYGQGIINGNASKDNWWKDPKKKVGAFRPRLVFLSNCKNICLQGITLKNSPSWTLHPYFSDDLEFYDLNVENPSDSPNTDGLDPESCRGVKIEGVRFSLGDDCIAIKSGKIYMGRKFKKPSEDIMVRQCLMENGHGAVTVGSEMAGGIKNITVRDCLFRRTDRGLRIKTRRGRGRDAIIDGITFENIDMDNVMTPFVVNSFYFCDPDGKTEYVQTRDEMPVDERTPHIGKMTFKDIKAENCHVAAAFFDGLPEEKIDEIVMENVEVSFSADPKSGQPAMSVGVEPCTKKGIFARNVKKLTLKNVKVTGNEGDATELIGVDSIEK